MKVSLIHILFIVFLGIVIFDAIYVMFAYVSDPTYYLSVKMGWNVNIVFPTGEHIYINPDFNVWILNTSGIYLNGSKLTFAWVSQIYSYREGFIVIPAVVGSGATASGYVDINVSSPQLISILSSHPGNALIVLDRSSSPLPYVVLTVNSSYIVYRVLLTNLTDGAHVVWIYAGGYYHYASSNITASQLPLLYNIMAMRPEPCYVLGGNSGGGGGYIPQTTSVTSGNQNTHTNARYVNNPLNRIRNIVSNALAYFIHNPEVLLIFILLFAGLVFVIVGSRRR